MSNPYAVSATLTDERGIFGSHAELIRGGLLHREIQLQAPISGTFIYDGRWFRQKITINGIKAWFRISWLTIYRHAEFKLPVEIDADQPTGRIEIAFSRGLMIRRFRVWIADQLVYDEIN
jgi:hypothetical protein